MKKVMRFDIRRNLLVSFGLLGAYSDFASPMSLYIMLSLYFFRSVVQLGRPGRL